MLANPFKRKYRVSHVKTNIPKTWCNALFVPLIHHPTPRVRVKEDSNPSVTSRVRRSHWADSDAVMETERAPRSRRQLVGPGRYRAVLAKQIWVISRSGCKRGRTDGRQYGRNAKATVDERGLLGLSGLSGLLVGGRGHRVMGSWPRVAADK